VANPAETTHFNKQKETTMKALKIFVLAVCMLTIAGNAGAVDLSGICCDGGFEYRHPSNWEKEQQRIKDELAAAQKQLADREREIASLRSSSKDALKSAQAEVDQSKSRIAELERQQAERDRELASLRSGAGESSSGTRRLRHSSPRHRAAEQPIRTNSQPNLQPRTSGWPT
jgi:peptidoglycan hydrolase CwlO-like protein